MRQTYANCKQKCVKGLKACFCWEDSIQSHCNTRKDASSTRNTTQQNNSSSRDACTFCTHDCIHNNHKYNHRTSPNKKAVINFTCKAERVERSGKLWNVVVVSPCAQPHHRYMFVFASPTSVVMFVWPFWDHSVAKKTTPLQHSMSYLSCSPRFVLETWIVDGLERLCVFMLMMISNQNNQMWRYVCITLWKRVLLFSVWCLVLCCMCVFGIF